MPLRPCLTCGTLSPSSRCPAHATGNTSWNGTRDRTAQATFRKLVLYNAGHRCQHPGCHVSNPADLQAHHTIPGNNDPRTGRALCRTHHREADSHAR